MRFFISSNIKNNMPIYIMVVFFLLFTLLYWISSWFLYAYKYGLTYASMYRYFYTDPEFPERIPLSQLLEDIHIQLFMFAIFILVLSSIFIHKCIRDKVKYVLIASAFVFGLLDILAGLGIYFLSSLLIYAKILFFIIFQVSTGIMLLLALKLYLSKEEEEPPERSILYSIVFIFAVSTLLFTLMNFFLFISKMGFSPSSINDYFAGNPEKFMRAKTIRGLMDVISPHFIAMGVYLLALAHFAFFTNIRKKVLLSALLMSLALVDNLSSLLSFGGVILPR